MKNPNPNPANGKLDVSSSNFLQCQSGSIVLKTEEAGDLFYAAPLV